MDRTQILWPGGRAVAAIRQVRPADQAALGDFFAGLSEQSRYLRFFGPVTPGPALLRLLIGDAGHDPGRANPGDASVGRTDAVVAIRGGVIIGHAMAVDQADPGNPRGPRATDIGVVVADAWQGRGVGAALVRALITGAQARGVTSVVMEVLPGNRRVLAMITSHWPAAHISRSPDSIGIRIPLPRHQQQQLPAHPVGLPAPASASVEGITGIKRRLAVP